MHADTFRLRHTAFKMPRHLLSGGMVFLAAYFVTISVNAQAISAPAAPDVIQLNEEGPAVVTGTVVEADENYVLINSAGTQMRVNLDEVDLKDDADTVFKPGMDVTVRGKMEGEDFGVPVITAESITASEPKLQ